MATFELIRELASIERDRGQKRLLLAVYSANDTNGQKNRYLACSEQQRSSAEEPWASSRKGITIRRSEVDEIISALQSADFDAKSDNKNLSNFDYATTLDWS